jgi:hypothetical protein
VTTAWDLIGFDPYDYDGAKGVRIVGGRTVYEAVANTRNDSVCLSRLDTTDGLRAVVRYVDPDTPMEVVK